jgi:hypothetical protein
MTMTDLLFPGLYVKRIENASYVTSLKLLNQTPKDLLNRPRTTVELNLKRIASSNLSEAFNANVLLAYLSHSPRKYTVIMTTRNPAHKHNHLIVSNECHPSYRVSISSCFNASTRSGAKIITASLHSSMPNPSPLHTGLYHVLWQLQMP